MKSRKFPLKYGYLPTYRSAALGFHIYVMLYKLLSETTIKNSRNCQKQKLGMYVTRINDIKLSLITQLSGTEKRGGLPKISISVTDFRN